jgi:membrane protease YdiL (CAAX protease family)
MDSVTPLASSVAAAQTPINGVAAAGPWAERLWLTDQVLWWAGLAVAAIIASVWLARSRRDPLAHPPPRPNRVLPEHVLGLIAGFLILAMVLQTAAGMAGPGDGLKLTAGNTAQLLGGIACLVMGAKLFDGGLRRFVLGRGRISLRLAEGVVLTLAALTLCGIVYGATEWVIGRVAPGYAPPEHSVIDALRTQTEPAWLLWLGAAVIAPVAEELFFRGLVQTVARNLSNRPWFAVLAAGVGFGLAHSQQPQVIPTIAVLGIILGMSYERSGSLVAPITLHALFNTKTLYKDTDLGSAGRRLIGLGPDSWWPRELGSVNGTAQWRLPFRARWARLRRAQCGRPIGLRRW